MQCSYQPQCASTRFSIFSVNAELRRASKAANVTRRSLNQQAAGTFGNSYAVGNDPSIGESRIPIQPGPRLRTTLHCDSSPRNETGLLAKVSGAPFIRIRNTGEMLSNQDGELAAGWKHFRHHWRVRVWWRRNWLRISHWIWRRIWRV